MDTERKEHFEGGMPTTFGEVDRYFRSNFNTLLSPEEEWRFHAVCDEESLNLDDELTDYDLRGAFKDGSMYENNRPDKYRKPNHPLFDSHSIHNGTPDIHNGGEYEGGEWGKSDCGRYTFKPSVKMLETTHPIGWLSAWMRQHEPGVVLVTDGSK